MACNQADQDFRKMYYIKEIKKSLDACTFCIYMPRIGPHHVCF